MVCKANGLCHSLIFLFSDVLREKKLALRDKLVVAVFVRVRLDEEMTTTCHCANRFQQELDPLVHKKNIMSEHKTHAMRLLQEMIDVHSYKSEWKFQRRVDERTAIYTTNLSNTASHAPPENDARIRQGVDPGSEKKSGTYGFVWFALAVQKVRRRAQSCFQ